MRTMRWRAVATAVVLLGAGLLAGCRTYIPITRYVPGRINIGAAKMLVLVQVKGRSSARQEVAAALTAAVRAGNYFDLQDRRDAGGDVVPSGDRVQLRGVEAPGAGELGLMIEVYQLTLTDSYREETSTHYVSRANGARDRVDEITEIPVTDAELVIGITLFDRTGRAILSEAEYVGRHSGDADRVGRAAIRSAVGRAALRRFFKEITPRRVREYVMVDKSDERQFPMIQRAARGDLEGAQAALERYVETAPDNPSAAYNLAVFTEALGNYDVALAYYDEAIALQRKGFYLQARDACALRKAHADELAGR